MVGHSKCPGEMAEYARHSNTVNDHTLVNLKAERSASFIYMDIYRERMKSVTNSCNCQFRTPILYKCNFKTGVLFAEIALARTPVVLNMTK